MYICYRCDTAVRKQSISNIICESNQKKNKQTNITNIPSFNSISQYKRLLWDSDLFSIFNYLAYRTRIAFAHFRFALAKLNLFPIWYTFITLEKKKFPSNLMFHDQIQLNLTNFQNLRRIEWFLISQISHVWFRCFFFTLKLRWFMIRMNLNS